MTKSWQGIKGFSRLALYALILSCGVGRADELEDRRVIRDAARDAYIVGDFEGLERQHLLYSDFFHQRTASGAFKATLFNDGIAEAVGNGSEKELKEDIARTEQWVKQHSASSLAYVFHAMALLTYGQHFRGRGYANTVPQQAWKVYYEYVGRAGKYLLEHQDVAAKDTAWHAAMLNVARCAGWREDVVLRIFDDGMKRNSADYRLYQNTLEYLLPKWYGNAEAVDRFIRQSTRLAPAEYGAELYARLYSGAEEAQFRRDLYADSLIEWSEMKQGLELWFQRFPTAWNKNIFAYHACLAGDKAIASKLLGEIGDAPDWEIWQPNAVATFETCKSWAADPQAEPQQPHKRQAEGAPT